MKNLVQNSINQVVSNPAIASLIAFFNSILNASFVGVRNYTSKTSGEVANYIINCGISYKNAVLSDLKTLSNVTEEQIEEIFNYANEKYSDQNISRLLIIQAIDKLKTGFEKNLNKETQSAQSKGQQDAYININKSVRLNKETGLFYIYGMVRSKELIKKGEYKTVNSRALTLAQNSVKKVLDFKTSKFRQFIVSKENLCEVKIKGETVTM